MSEREDGRAPGWMRAAGWLLIVVPFLPLALIFDDPPGTTWLLGPREWLLGVFVFGAVAILMVRFAPAWIERQVARVRLAVEAPAERPFRLGGLAVVAGLLIAASVVAFSRRPLLIDSIIQLFQARIFASGAVSAPAPPAEAFFTTQHMVLDGAKWYSQYPPGHSALLSLGVHVGAPWLIPILLSVGSAWLIADFSSRIYGRLAGRTTLLFLILAPFFWFMGASHMNHVSSLFFVTLFAWGFQRWESGAKSLAGIACTGAALGAAFLSRPLTALAVGAAFAWPALRVSGRRWWSTALAGAAGFAAVAAFYFGYNAATTGDPLIPGYLRLWGEGHGLGFHASPWGDPHTPLTGLRNELIDLGLLNSFLFEWAVPALFPLGIAAAAGWLGRTWDRRLMIAFLAIPAAYFFYWHRDAFLGPRYLYEGLPFVLPLFVRAVFVLRERLSERRPAWLDGGSWSTVLAALIALSVVYSALYATPGRFRVYASGLASLKLDLAADARNAGIDRGLVFVAVSWGNRLIARSREAGASASTVELVYRRSDHCDLEQVMLAAEAGGWSGAQLDAALLEIIRPEAELDQPQLNNDVTLRLLPNRPLADPCAREILYDRDGYANYSPHLVANPPHLDGDLIFARDLGPDNARLMARYPDRPAYLYRPGRFIPLRTDRETGSPDHTDQR